MSLTPDERRVALAARYFGPAWGDGLHGLCPSGSVANKRGVKFRFNRVNDRWYPVGVEAIDSAWEVIVEVAAEFGYPDVHEYLAVERKGQDPFEKERRCTDEN